MGRIAFVLVLAALGCVTVARAQGARVEAVQYPAWLERGGRAVPLTPGTALQAQDKLRTGGNARVQLKLPEGSTVKLGENAQFVIERSESRGIFRAALSVISGAFRFTSDALRKRQGRDISIRVRNVTAGIRGTDLWGKSTDARDLVCLLEGRINVGSDGNPAVTLDRRGAFYQKARDGAPEVASVDDKQIDIWSKETEIDPEGAAARVDGGWRVVASKFERRDAALALGRELRGRGYPAEVGGEDGGIWYVQITGLAGETQARAVMSNIRGVPGVTIPSVLPMAPRR